MYRQSVLIRASRQQLLDPRGVGCARWPAHALCVATNQAAADGSASAVRQPCCPLLGAPRSSPFQFVSVAYLLTLRCGSARALRVSVCSIAPRVTGQTRCVSVTVREDCNSGRITYTSRCLARPCVPRVQC